MSHFIILTAEAFILVIFAVLFAIPRTTRHGSSKGHHRERSVRVLGYSFLLAAAFYVASEAYGFGYSEWKAESEGRDHPEITPGDGFPRHTVRIYTYRQLFETFGLVVVSFIMLSRHVGSYKRLPSFDMVSMLVNLLSGLALLAASNSLQWRPRLFFAWGSLLVWCLWVFNFRSSDDKPKKVSRRILVDKILLLISFLLMFVLFALSDYGYGWMSHWYTVLWYAVFDIWFYGILMYYYAGSPTEIAKKEKGEERRERKPSYSKRDRTPKVDRDSSSSDVVAHIRTLDLNAIQFTNH